MQDKYFTDFVCLLFDEVRIKVYHTSQIYIGFTNLNNQLLEMEQEVQQCVALLVFMVHDQ